VGRVRRVQARERSVLDGWARLIWTSLGQQDTAAAPDGRQCVGGPTIRVRRAGLGSEVCSLHSGSPPT
jgi:hypothetical protein